MSAPQSQSAKDKGKCLAARPRVKGGEFLRDEGGAAAVTTALCLTVFLGLLALVLDVGHLLAVRSEVQNVADAAALAGTRALFPYQGYPNSKLIPVTNPPYCSLAISTAEAATSENGADSLPNLTVAAGDVQTGTWNWTARQFTADSHCSTAINAVRVTIRKDSLANQPVAMWFARIFGIDTVSVEAQAVAAVGFVNGWGPGDFFNIAIQWSFLDKMLHPPDGQSPPEYILMNPDKIDNGGWCGPADENINASYLKDAINGNSTDGVSFSDQLTLVNGVINSVFQALDSAIARNSYNWPNADGTTTRGWLVYLPIVNVSQFNQTTTPYQPIDSSTGLPDSNTAPFQPAILTDVYLPNDKDNPLGNAHAIEFKLYTGPPLGKIGGGTGGPLSQIHATIPKLVQ